MRNRCVTPKSIDQECRKSAFSFFKASALGSAALVFSSCLTLRQAVSNVEQAYTANLELYRDRCNVPSPPAPCQALFTAMTHGRRDVRLANGCTADQIDGEGPCTGRSLIDVGGNAKDLVATLRDDSRAIKAAQAVLLGKK